MENFTSIHSDLISGSTTSSPLHRHQSSLQHVLDFSSPAVLEPDQCCRATEIFSHLVSRFEPIQSAGGASGARYRRITLLRLMHQAVVSRDRFLTLFFLFVCPPAEGQHQPHTEDDTSLGQPADISQALSSFDDLDSWSPEQTTELEEKLHAFSDYIVDNLFLPLKATGRQTPQPSPQTLSGIQSAGQIIGTTERLSGLRWQCLQRDRHRCVITRCFDSQEAKTRILRDGRNFQDDDGNPVLDGEEMPEYLEVAHIIPHSLTSLSGPSGNQQLGESKKIALDLLSMFDPGIRHLIEGPDIDRPTNAMSLTFHFHQLFGNFEVSFQPTEDGVPHSYKIDYVAPVLRYINKYPLPVFRNLYITPDHNIDPPSPRLLAVHHAIAGILHMSGAAIHIESILDDWEKMLIKADGTTELGRCVALKLSGWLEGVQVC